MHSFTLHLPTELHFGNDKGAAFAASAARLRKRVFVVTGTGYVVRIGYLAEVVRLLGGDASPLAGGLGAGAGGGRAAWQAVVLEGRYSFSLVRR